MSVRASIAVLLAAALAAAAGCERRIESGDDGPLTFVVEITAGDVGSARAPRPFAHEPFAVTLDVAALDRAGAPATWFDGRLHLAVEPRGELAEGQGEWIDMAGGVATGVTVQLVDVHNVANVWVENVGTDEEPGNYATGLSEEIWARDPTIRNVQEVTPNGDLPTWLTSALPGDFVLVDLEDRTAVVTGVTNDGCYVTDVSEPGLAYSSIYVYSHSRPAVAVGDRIAALSGTADEFYGFTELSFPSWKVDGTAEVPSPVLIDATIVDDDNALEQYESALVEVDDVVLCPLGDGFYSYGQWAVLVDPDAACGGTAGLINVVSAFAAAEFDPEAHVGETLASVRGNLRFHSAADPSWIIYVRSEDDIAAAAE